MSGQPNSQLLIDTVAPLAAIGSVSLSPFTLTRFFLMYGTIEIGAMAQWLAVFGIAGWTPHSCHSRRVVLTENEIYSFFFLKFFQKELRCLPKKMFAILKANIASYIKRV